jgi:starvation-inducible DNA-binding protein
MEENMFGEDMYEELSGMQVRLDAGESAMGNVPLVRHLNKVLANTTSVALEAHGFHWNVKGPDFAQYHALFDSIYEAVDGSIDDIAESILRLGFDSPFHMSELMGMRTIHESNPTDTPQAMATELLHLIDTLVVDADEGFEIASAVEQQGVADMFAGLIFDLQKWAWQLRASIGAQLPNRIR